MMMFKTREQIFNQVRDHLLQQMERSVDSKGYCKYRSPAGLKCAVGALIDDEHYDPRIESITVVTLADDVHGVSILLKSGIDIADPLTLKLLDRLQRIHDITCPSEWEGKLHQLANQYGF